MSRTRRTVLAALSGILAAGVILTISHLAQNLPSPPEPLPVLGRLAAAELVDSAGRSFSLEELQGKIWIADFIFTHCAGPCPLLSRKMARLQAKLEDFPDVRLVSFTVDPDRDTPAVLAAYARRHGADPGRWIFLTGEKSRLYPLISQGFKLAVDDGAESGGLITHSTRFVLVDRLGRVRGYYEGATAGSEERLLADLERLAAGSDPESAAGGPG
jgi:protein SCO1/2